MKRPPSLQLFDAREEGKGTGRAYGRVMEPVPETPHLTSAEGAMPVSPVVETPAIAKTTVAPRVIA